LGWPACGAPSKAVVRCRLLGHRFRLTSDGASLRWSCLRGCGTGGGKRYQTAEAADRYAMALDREHVRDRGRLALSFGLLSLRIAWLLRRRRR
jgi:hypothetical protein